MSEFASMDEWVAALQKSHENPPSIDELLEMNENHLIELRSKTHAVEEAIDVLRMAKKYHDKVISELKNDLCKPGMLLQLQVTETDIKASCE